MVTNSWCTELANGATLVTVNQRLSRHYLSRYQQWQISQGASWWETPEILPWASWLENLHAKAVENGVTQSVMMAEISQQRLWHQCLQKDSKLTALLDIDAAAANARRAWYTRHAWLDAGVVSAQSVDQIAYQRWSNLYRQRCQTEQLLDGATIVDHLLSLLASSGGINLPDTVLLAGFLNITRQQQRWIDALSVRDVDIHYVRPALRAQLYRHEYANERVELAAIAAQTRTQLTRNINCSMGVVVPDLHQRRAQVLRQFDQVFFPLLNPDQITAIGRPYDISLGLPLSELDVVRIVLLLIQLSVVDIDNTELTMVLLSPYVMGADVEARARETLDRQCRERRIRSIDRRGLIKVLHPASVLRKALEKGDRRRWSSRASSTEWATRFGQLLSELGRLANTSSEELQAVQAWYGCLDDMQKLGEEEQLTAAAALSMLRRLTGERLFQPEMPATPIQIMGRLESHGVEFDRLWVTGFDTESWPPTSSPAAFLSIIDLRAAGQPEASESARLEMARREFALWQCSADEMMVSNCQSRDGVALAPAAIVSAMPTLKPMQLSAPEGVIDVLLNPANRVFNESVLESVADINGPPLMSGDVVRGGARLFENQARCPFKSFALHRLQIKPLEEAGLGLDARQHGTLLHLALEFFWKKLRSHAVLVAMDGGQLDAEINHAITQALDSQSLGSSLRRLELRRLNRLLHEWIELCEKPRKPFEAVEFEVSREVEQGGIRMNVQVDRVDKLESGHTVILDYKTGIANSIKSWHEARIDSPQLPLYALTDNSVEGVCFAQVARHKCKFIGIASEDGLIPNVKSASEDISDWQGWREHWQYSLDTVAAEVRNALASVTPAKNACTHCDLTPLCRIEKRAITDDVETSSSELDR